MDDQRDRVEALRQRIRAARSNLPDAPDIAALQRLGDEDLQRQLGIDPRSDGLDVRLHGKGVVDHHVPVRKATAILSSIQETITAIGQAVTRTPTSRGTIERWIQDATQLTLSPRLSTGSLVFHLANRAAQEPALFNSVEPGSTSLVDDAVVEMMGVLNQGEDGVADGDVQPLAARLRRFGPRTGKHLHDLVTRVVEDDIDVEMVWRSTKRPTRVDLRRDGASLVRDAITRNEHDSSVVQVTGRLQTVSVVRSADLITDDGLRYKIVVPAEWRPLLGRYFNRTVDATLRELVTWSTATGVERRTYELVSLPPADEEAPDVLAVRSPATGESALGSAP